MTELLVYSRRCAGWGQASAQNQQSILVFVKLLLVLPTESETARGKFPPEKVQGLSWAADCGGWVNTSIV